MVLQVLSHITSRPLTSARDTWLIKFNKKARELHLGSNPLPAVAVSIYSTDFFSLSESATRCELVIRIIPYVRAEAIFVKLRYYFDHGITSHSTKYSARSTRYSACSTSYNAPSIMSGAATIRYNAGITRAIFSPFLESSISNSFKFAKLALKFS